MNDHEIERIAAALNALRPDWPTRSLQTLLKRSELVNRPRRDVTVALAWVACESGTATPARVLEAGPWWRAATVENTTRPLEHLAPEDRCRICSKSRPDCERYENHLRTSRPADAHQFEPDIRHPKDYDVSPVITELKGHLKPRPAATPPQPAHTPGTATKETA